MELPYQEPDIYFTNYKHLYTTISAISQIRSSKEFLRLIYNHL